MSRVPRLLVIDPAGERREATLTAFPFHIGRQSGNELVLGDSRISRLQAQITASDGALLLEDLGSRNGTFVNGKPIREPQPLRARDAIDFGIPDSYKLVYLGSELTLGELIDMVGRPAGALPATRDLHHLSVLLEVARTMSSRLSLEEVLATVVDAAVRLTHTGRGVLLLGDLEAGFKPAVARSTDGRTIPSEDLHISLGVLRQAASSHRELIVNTPSASPEIAQQASIVSLALETVVAVPLEQRSTIAAADATLAGEEPKLVGMLYLDSRSPSIAFSETDRDILRALAREAATVIENAQLFATAQAKARLDQELDIASEIQRQLVPKTLPQTPTLATAAFTVACRQVGGDCFDVVELGHGCYGFLLGDVSGKGVAASLLAALLQGIFSTIAGLDLGLEEIARRVNQYLYARSSADRYATLFYGVLHPDGRLEYINAGQPAPLVLRKPGELLELPSTNFPVGMFPDAQFTVSSMSLLPGDLVVISSDGITDAASSTGEMFGEERLRSLVRGAAGDSATELADRAHNAARSFSTGTAQADDMTMIVIEYKGPPPEGSVGAVERAC